MVAKACAGRHCPLKRRIAFEMLRVLKKKGLIVWYDFLVSNPRNPVVRGLRKRGNIPVLFPVHPRTTKRIMEFHFETYFDFSEDIRPIDSGNNQIQCIPPLGYLDFLCLMSNARLILTDSGGIQEETLF
jgi:UDP-N-acetylglucosamine 2-epimerase